ncbi:PhzF family phenazine biosynthesis protein [Roseibacterium sp. SDUM158017]|uniref:PhzF family phenazine biosynthesis protein n=1 Tax=Roseicyclus salinarum TaxID=3036773 RepID=UPI00241558A1|nr:PhzF family phenazine biosynthesis protein [Roseibacterium sp. SDUM158017]MDG4647904.1 PhzF family phenazine biosynthesis protein [Roseibacterium sp. SDUM158017]
MEIEHIAAFSKEEDGGNPAGVALLEHAASVAEMARVAAQVGYSETVFAYPLHDGTGAWRVRYFAPEAEVPFCGHATIALGAVLGMNFGAGTYPLVLNASEIEVEAEISGPRMKATLSSPPTKSRPTDEMELRQTLDLLGLSLEDLDGRLPPARIHAGADHIALTLLDRTRLAAMRYDLGKGREMMRRLGLVTIMLVHAENDRTFVARNAFASGGVVEDPATGAAAAAFAGYLRDLGWPHGGHITIRQGEDMRVPCLIEVRLADTPGSSVHVSGQTRFIQAASRSA